ncbi:MAG: hypothetical protein AVDCRST_MAG45-1542, partial [uncultured Solirubrobacterales bacterium]
ADRAHALHGGASAPSPSSTESPPFARRSRRRERSRGRDEL